MAGNRGASAKVVFTHMVSFHRPTLPVLTPASAYLLNFSALWLAMTKVSHPSCSYSRVRHGLTGKEKPSEPRLCLAPSATHLAHIQHVVCLLGELDGRVPLGCSGWGCCHWHLQWGHDRPISYRAARRTQCLCCGLLWKAGVLCFAVSI